jgi:hypothetical protein
MAARGNPLAGALILLGCASFKPLIIKGKVMSRPVQGITAGYGQRTMFDGSGVLERSHQCGVGRPDKRTFDLEEGNCGLPCPNSG